MQGCSVKLHTPSAVAAEYSPFYGIEKGAVLQEARIFNDSHIDPRKCQQVWFRSARDAAKTLDPSASAAFASEPHLCHSYTVAAAWYASSSATVGRAAQVITKLLYLLCQGETFSQVPSMLALQCL